MLSQLLIVRLKAAENALKDGRLDEAYRLAIANDIREHRRGAGVLSSLAERFMQRARTHLQAERFTEALMDLDRANAGGVRTDEIAELRDQVQKVQNEQQRVDQSRRDRLAAAKRRIEQGSLVAGKRMLDQASQADHDAQGLRLRADEKLAEIQSAVAFIKNLIAQGQLSQAAERIRKASKTDAHNADLAQVEGDLCARVIQNAMAALIEGRIGRAEDELACLGTLGDSLPGKKEIADILAIARQATRCMRQHEYADARRHCMSLHRLLPKAAWLKHASSRLRTLDDGYADLVAGPLGENLDGAQAEPRRAAAHAVVEKPMSLDDTVALPRRGEAARSRGEHLLLLVDGGGSYLILQGDSASIGRAAASHPADLPIFSDLAERHANVARVEDDYFLFSGKELEVGGRKTKHQLLRDSDRIVLGRKAKLTFRIPSRRSPTAVLDLSDTTKMPNDVRRAVLFSGHATIGSGPTAHISCRHAAVPLILFERNGSLWIRPKNDGHVDTTPQQLVIGKTIEMAGASLVLEPWKIRSPGGSA